MLRSAAAKRNTRPQSLLASLDAEDSSMSTSTQARCPARSGSRISPAPTARAPPCSIPCSLRCRPTWGAWHHRPDRVLRSARGRPSERGETVVVSGAAGATGSIAGQIAQDQGMPDGRHRRRAGEVPLDRRGARVRRGHRLQGRGRPRALREHAPDGVDVFFDNVGGEILDAVLTRLARGARIVISGGRLAVQRRPSPVARRTTCRWSRLGRR